MSLSAPTPQPCPPSRATQLIDAHSTPFCFTLTRPSGKYFRLCADSEEVCDKWFQAFAQLGVCTVLPPRKRKLPPPPPEPENTDAQEVGGEQDGSSPSLPFSILVTGAGTEEANGLYVPSAPAANDGAVLHLAMLGKPEFTLSRELVRGAYGWVIGKKPEAL